MSRRVEFLALYAMWVVVDVDAKNSRERRAKGGWYSERDAETVMDEDHEWEDWTPNPINIIRDRNIVLVDIDHTLRNSFRRDGMIGVASWDDYHRAGADDGPIIDVVNLINALKGVGWKTVGLTAIPAKFRALTTMWLLKHRVLIDEILMRPDEAFRPSPAMKMELALSRFPDIKDRVAFLIEDRPDVCEAFRALGITVLQVHARRS